MSNSSPPEPGLQHRLAAEFFGTFLLVFGGAGTAAIAGSIIGPHGVALAFGLTVVAGAYAFGHLSGGHFNPAVTVGAFLAKRMDPREVVPYILTQIVAGIVAGGVIAAVVSGNSKSPGVSKVLAGVSNGWGDHSPGGYSLGSALIIEVVLTAVFLFVILGVTDTRAPKGFAPLAIGLTLTLIHLISIPVDNTSVNPARSLGTAIFGGGDPLSQVWLFLIAPCIGAAIAGLSYKAIFTERTSADFEEAMDA